MRKDKTANVNQFIDQAFNICEISAQEENSLAFMAHVLVQATLPHKNPGNVIAWGRQNGNFSLAIKPGVEIVNGEPKSYGLPYGSIPRLLLAWITTEVTRTKERKVFLGNSLSEFMRELGLVPTGGRWGSIRRLKDQTQRLFQSTISFEYNDEKQKSWLNMQIAPKGQLWWDTKQPEQDELFGSWIELGEDFFNALTSSPVPVDMRALKALKQSPLALDLYMWLTYRMSYLDKKTAIPWKSLQQQFGADYKRSGHFVEKSKDILKKIQILYPDLKLEEARGRLILHPSPTHIRKQLNGE